MAQAAAVTSIEELAEAYGEAWNAQDVDAIMAFHTPDTIFQLHLSDGDAVEGIDAVREVFAGLVAAYPGLRFETVALHTGPDHWVLRSEMVLGERRAAAVDVITVRDGKLASKHTYLDAVAAGLAT